MRAIAYANIVALERKLFAKWIYALTDNITGNSQ